MVSNRIRRRWCKRIGKKMKDIEKRDTKNRGRGNLSHSSLTENKEVRANYNSPQWKRKGTKAIKTTEMSLQQPERFPHIFLQGLKYHKIRTK